MLPGLRIEPSLDAIQAAVENAAEGIVNASNSVQWWAADTNTSFHSSIVSEENVIKAHEKISTIITGKYQGMQYISLSAIQGLIL